jgi:predicted transglutaminase-like cysteine proteinase
MSEELIASKLLVAQKLLANKHVHETQQQIANSIEAANPTTLPVSFDELLASIVTLCGERKDVSANWANSHKSELAEPKKRKIFYELVAAQDAGVGDERAYIIIAKRFNISVAEVQEIGIEGAMRDWSMP